MAILCWATKNSLRGTLTKLYPTLPNFSISSDAVVSECLTRQCALSTSLQCQQQLL
jgi:hypothetical protein